jgi:hypothetical protein
MGARSSAERRVRLSTCTVQPDGRHVPWLAAHGELAYRPEAPPARDYFFQYGSVLPGVFADEHALRRHRYFGASRREDANELFGFWCDGACYQCEDACNYCWGDCRRQAEGCTPVERAWYVCSDIE